MTKRTGNASGKRDGRGVSRGAHAADRPDDGDAHALAGVVHTLGVGALQAVFTADALAGPRASTSPNAPITTGAARPRS
jgi:hypothetical protein